jgi:hypothetical protein
MCSKWHQNLFTHYSPISTLAPENGILGGGISAICLYWKWLKKHGRRCPQKGVKILTFKML